MTTIGFLQKIFYFKELSNFVYNYPMQRLKKVRRVLTYTLVLNLAVAVAKIIYGYLTNSISMFSDGFHSFFDGTSNVIGLASIWLASQPPDKNHPYGHKKYETLSTIAIAVLIFIAGIEILKKAYHGFTEVHIVEVTSLSFIIMAVTLLINMWVMTYEKKKGLELKSDFLLADALHTKTDIFVSLSVIISLIAVKTGYPVIDSIAAVVIAVFIGRMGFEILKSAAEVLTDAARLDSLEINNVVLQIQGIRECHEIRTRGKEDSIHIDLHVLVDPEVQIQKAHELSHSVEEIIKKNFPSVVDVIVHIEPYESET
ncbi:MAG: cation transporter [Nitrospirae bacterium]|nr:cation transporter [Nitrospirota bacterium]